MTTLVTDAQLEGQIAGQRWNHIRLGATGATRLIDTGGSGTPLVLVHGIATSLEQWEAVLPGLADGRRLIAYDLLGFGFADKPTDVEYRYPTFVRQLEEVLDYCDVPKADMLGSSLGASLLVRFSALRPGRIRRAVMANPGGFGRYVHPFLRVPTTPLLGKSLSRPMRPTSAFGVRLALADKSLATKAAIDGAYELSKLPGAHHAFQRTLAGVASPLGVKERDSFEQQWRTMAEPTMLVWGKQDKLFPAKQSARALELRGDARLELIDRCGHFPQLDTPARLVELTRSHLQ